MKKGSTAAAKENRNFSQQKLTIGLDLGDRNSWYCVVNEAAQPDRAGDEDAFALDQSLARRIGPRSDRGECAQGASNRGEPQEGRSFGRADLGAAGPDRSPVAVSGEASQRAGASGSDDDSGTSRTGAGAHRAGQHGSRTGEVLWRAAARMQCAQHESGESGRAQPGTATGTGAVAVGDRRAERADS